MKVTQEAKEMVGTLTMNATFMITLLVFFSYSVTNRQDTVIIRGLVNQVVMLLTIIIWNMHNSDLWKFTKSFFVKEE